MKKTIAILLFISTIYSCDKPDKYYSEFLKTSDKNYPGKLQDVVASNGYYRIKIKYTLPPNNSANKIAIANGNDTMYFDIQANKSGLSDSLIIEGLKETNYRYSIFTISNENIKSIIREVTFKVYGDNYKASLSTLNIKSQSIISGTNNLKIIFNGDKANKLVKSKFEYTQTDGELTKVDFLNPTDTIILKNFKAGSSIYLSNGFLPNANSFDTVYTPIKKILN